VPEWYRDAKLGIFIHWSLASVPGYAPREHEINELLRTRYDDMLPLSPYTEWYENAIKFPWSPSAAHHREHWNGRPYASFKDDFVRGLEQWDPEGWAERFRRAGARWVVFVTKHHDGFCLWPSQVENLHHAGWNTGRDCVGELARAVRARRMRFGVYYSGGIDWSFETRPVRTFTEFIASMPRGDYPDYAEAQVRELVDAYSPDVLWNDISWPTGPERLWRLIADYYGAVPEGLVNDRWLTAGWPVNMLRIRPLRALVDAWLRRRVRSPGVDLTPPPPPHFDVRTPEYAVFDDIRPEAWECVRGMDKSFGYNRASLPEDFLGRDELIHSLVDIVSKNGNLLLNVGPRGKDGVIPAVQLERLDWLGEWLSQSGESLYGTRPWRRAEGRTDGGLPVRFTARGDAVYAIVLGTPSGTRFGLEGVCPADGESVRALGRELPVHWRRTSAGVALELEAPLPAAPAHAFAISRVAE
jgi:alpha-L-fucosidase